LKTYDTIIKSTVGQINKVTAKKNKDHVSESQKTLGMTRCKEYLPCDGHLVGVRSDGHDWMLNESFERK